MVRPERRTRGDLIAVAVIVVAVALAASLVWRFSDARATVSTPARSQPEELAPPETLPPSLAASWRAPSGATPAPVVAESTVVTADGREVIGRDPLTGQQRWRYARDIDLCTVTSAWGNALTVWTKDPSYCSEVTALDGDSGRRTAQRNGDAERGTRVLFDGNHATAIGQRYLETWRSDLVRTTQYGAVPTPLNPGKQPRQGCTYTSAGAGSNQIAVVEHCGADSNEPGELLTVLRANPKEAETPEVLFSVRLPEPQALVAATSAQHTAVLLPVAKLLAVFDAKGNRVGSYTVDAPAADPAAPGPAVTETTVTPTAVYWYTGESTIALDVAEFRPLWTQSGTLGPGVLFAGRLLVPAPGQLIVLDAETGARVGATPVDRGGYTGPVPMATIGPVVLEQRGTELVALR